MDTMMNYNTTPNSQVLPYGIEHVLPEIYHQIKADEFRGDFLSVVGRFVDDAALLDTFWYHYSQVKSGKHPASKHVSIFLQSCLSTLDRRPCDIPPAPPPPSQINQFFFSKFIRNIPQKKIKYIYCAKDCNPSEPVLGQVESTQPYGKTAIIHIKAISSNEEFGWSFKRIR